MDKELCVGGKLFFVVLFWCATFSIIQEGFVTINMFYKDRKINKYF